MEEICRSQTVNNEVTEMMEFNSLRMCLMYDLTFIGRTVQRVYQRMYFSLAERYNVCTAASYLC
jgi:hypothetical protein